MHPPELERQRQRDRFDPVVEGDRYGLSRDLSLAIWERVCAEATDREGRRDAQQAERRFHEIAARIAARGGRLRPDVGRLTRVGIEISGVPAGAWGAKELAPRTPGRETLVAVEARRRGVQDQVSPALEDADAATGRSELPDADEMMRAMAALQKSVRPEPARPLPPAVQSHARRPLDLRVWAPPTRRPPAPEVPSVVAERNVATAGAELPGVNEVMRAMAALQPSVRPEPATLLPPALQSYARRPLDLRVWTPPTRQPAAPEVPSAGAERRDPLQPADMPTRGVAEAPVAADRAMAVAARAGGAAASLAAQMRRTFGVAAGDIAITPDSPRPLAAGAEGVAVGEQVYIAPGYYDLTTTAGRERLGHEVTHVLQQRRGRDLPGWLSASERAGLEAEADRAGHAFARGQPFAVQGRAPAQVALFKGAAPASAPATTTTTIDLKSGGRIERKPPASDPTGGGDTAAAPTAGGKDKPKAKEQLIVSYGAVQASNPFMLERDESGEAKRLVGSGTISLSASKYMKKLDLAISLGADGYVVAKLRGSATTTIQIGGLTIQSGTLTAAIDHGPLSYALDGATLALPKNIGDGALTIQGNGDQAPAFDASLAINVPKMQPATMSFHADVSGYRAEGSTGVDIKQASGSVTFSLEKVGDDKALWSAAGSVGYSSERLSGQISVQYNADGELSGEGNLDFQIADFLTGQATVAVDKEGHVTVNGEIRPPNETQLFPEKKVEQTFFHKSVDFLIWGISIPMVGSVGIIAFIEGSMGVSRRGRRRRDARHRALGPVLDRSERPADVPDHRRDPHSGVRRAADQHRRRRQARRVHRRHRRRPQGRRPRRVLRRTLGPADAGLRGWQVKDLDEVAVKAPHAIVVTHPVHVEKLSEALNKALGSARSGQIIANQPGDPKQITRQLLEKHEDARFDFSSARLTLPALHPAPLQAAHSADQLGQLLAQQTGVSKVTLKQTEQKGELKFEIVGAIGGASATLGTAVVDAVPHSLAVPHPVHLEKPSEPLSRALGSAHSGQVILHTSGDPRQETRQLLQRHGDAHFDAHFDFPSGKLTLPSPQAAPLAAAHSVDQLGQLLAQQTGVTKVTLKQTAQKGELQFELIGAIGEATATLGTVTLPKPSVQWATHLAAADDHAKPTLKEVLDADPQKYLKPADWAAATAQLKEEAKISLMIKKPLLFEHAFGSAAHRDQAVPAADRALKGLGEDAPSKTPTRWSLATRPSSTTGRRHLPARRTSSQSRCSTRPATRPPPRRPCRPSSARS
jgi:hypothetical protein